jgi:integrase
MEKSKFQNTNFPGVRYRVHPTRKNGVQFDRYFTIRLYVDGKRVEEGVGWSTEGWNAKKAAALRTELQNNAKTGEGPRTLAEMREKAQRDREKEQREADALAKRDVSFKSFFENYFLPEARTRWKKQTTDKAIQHVNNWIDPVTGKTPIRDIDLIHINKVKTNLADAGRSPRTQQYVFRTFSMIWAAAFDHNYVAKPCPTKTQSFRLPKVDNERQRYLTIEEETKLLEELKTISEQSFYMALVSLDAGLRFGEIASLTWACVDLSGGALRILNTKSGRDRHVPMTERLKSTLDSIHEEDCTGLVFPNPNGEPWSEAPKAFRNALKKSGLNAGVTDPKLKVSFHSLRHTYASRLVQSGIDLYRVQRLLGHSTPVMTQRYSKRADDDLRLAVETMERKRNGNPDGGKVIPFKRKA